MHEISISRTEDHQKKKILQPEIIPEATHIVFHLITANEIKPLILTNNPERPVRI